MTYGPYTRCPFHVLYGRPSVRDERSMRHSKAILGTTEDQHALIMSPLFYIVPLEARASPFHYHLQSLVLRRQHGDRRREGAVLLTVHCAGDADGSASRDHRDDLQ